jgi:hypothetical protein
MAPTTLTIPGPQNDDIVGILEQKRPNPEPGTKVIIMLHGHAYFPFRLMDNIEMQWTQELLLPAVSCGEITI